MGRWVYNPHTGGKKIPPAVQERTKHRILTYANVHYAGKFTRLGIRFRNQFCYIDAYTEPDPLPDALPPDLPMTREEFLDSLRNTPIHLCRLRYLGDEQAWSLAFYKYSDEKYEPCFFRNGTFHGTPEEAFDIGAVYLQP